METFNQPEKTVVGTTPNVGGTRSGTSSCSLMSSPSATHRLDVNLESGLAKVLSLRVGCWRPPVYLKGTR